MRNAPCPGLALVEPCGRDTATCNDDPFADIERLRIASDLGAIGVRELPASILVRRPAKQEFVRVHSDLGYRLDTAVIDFQEEKTFYLVAPVLREQLQHEIRFVRLFVAVTRFGAVFLWPVALPGPEGRHNPWHESAHQAALEAMIRWTRVQADQALGRYRVISAHASLDEPQWPELAFRDLLRLAFRDRFVGTPDHPVLHRIRGQL